MKRLKANFKYFDERGSLIEVCKGREWRQMNFFDLKKGFSRGGHYHRKTQELFFVIEGKCQIRIVNVKNGKEIKFIAKEKEIFLIEPYEAHYLKAVRDTKIIALLTASHNKNKPDIHEPTDSRHRT